MLFTPIMTITNHLLYIEESFYISVNNTLIIGTRFLSLSLSL